jgi:hypothetical protein
MPSITVGNAKPYSIVANIIAKLVTFNVEPTMFTRSVATYPLHSPLP